MWEEIPEPNNGHYQVGNTLVCTSHRMKVPGGWILRTITCGYNIGAAAHQVFITDPQHEWQLDTTSENS